MTGGATGALEYRGAISAAKAGTAKVMAAAAAIVPVRNLFM
jgi:hypothetical protein